MDYRKAGVNLDAAEDSIEIIKKVAQNTFRPEVLQGIGGFGGLFSFQQNNYKEPVLVSGADGVGTKLRIAFKTGIHSTIGEDCVAMCVNDILVQGAEPLFFLDYLAVGKIENITIKEVIKGIAEGCKKSGCALLGGETAEMPDFYPSGEYELAGFSVGVVEKSQIIDGADIKSGDKIIGLASSGIHSNGFSLIRKIMDLQGLSLEDHPEMLTMPLGKELLQPTRIYVPYVLPLLSQHSIKGMAHITGGGLPGNINRILPSGVKAVLDSNHWDIPDIFHYFKEQGNVKLEEMYNVFNMGIGFVLVVPSNEEDPIKNKLDSLNMLNWTIGIIDDLPYHNDLKVIIN